MGKLNLMIVQGGGPTAVVNASLAAIIRQGQQSATIGAIYGASFGMQGLVRGNVVELSSLRSSDLDLLRRTPGAALGSSRHKPAEHEVTELLRHLEKLRIGALVFIGGNGTMRGARIVGELCAERRLEMAVVGVPKTIDNDLSTTARCPGYGSAARFAAVSARELAADNRSLPQPITILETLGRNVGWIAAATVLARQDAQDEAAAPHLVYVPEIPFAEEEFLARLDAVVRSIGWAVVTVGEGIRHADGRPVYQTNAPGQADQLQRPMIGGVARHLAAVVGQRLGLRCRSEIPGLLGRSSAVHVSARDLEDATVVGHDAIAALNNGKRDVMIALEPLAADEGSRTRLVPLELASGEECGIPAEWLCEGSIPVNEKFLEYVRPLAGPIERHIGGIGVPVEA